MSNAKFKKLDEMFYEDLDEYLSGSLSKPNQIKIDSLINSSEEDKLLIADLKQVNLLLKKSKLDIPEPKTFPTANQILKIARPTTTNSLSSWSQLWLFFQKPIIAFLLMVTILTPTIWYLIKKEFGYRQTVAVIEKDTSPQSSSTNLPEKNIETTQPLSPSQVSKSNKDSKKISPTKRKDEEEGRSSIVASPKEIAISVNDQERKKVSEPESDNLAEAPKGKIALPATVPTEKKEENNLDKRDEKTRGTLGGSFSTQNKPTLEVQTEIIIDIETNNLKKLEKDFRAITQNHEGAILSIDSTQKKKLLLRALIPENNLASYMSNLHVLGKVIKKRISNQQEILANKNSIDSDKTDKDITNKKVIVVIRAHFLSFTIVK